MFSIVTVVYNGSRHIEETISRIINQDFDGFEYIVVDGGSTDGTVDILRRHSDSIDYWVSEADSGISDAFNKGVCLSSGKYLNFQGDGDGFSNSSALSHVSMIADGSMMLAGRIRRISEEGTELFISPPLRNKYKSSMLTRMPFPHQGLFMNRAYFDKYGLFDTSLRFSMDYELLLRSYSSPESVKTTDMIIANWRAGGVGTGREHELFEEYKRIRIMRITLPRCLVGFISDLARWKFMLTKKLKSLL